MRSRQLLTELIERRTIPPARMAEALALARVSPDGRAWKAFVDRLLLWLGGLALAFAVLFFVAYNWDEIGRFAKFGMVEAAIALAVIAYWKFGDGKITGKVSLLVATILLGVLLALYGQTYQTGADPWQLFFTWSMLMLPWTFIARFAAMWVLWIGLVNLSVVLYSQTFGGLLWLSISTDSETYWVVFLVNTLALAVWELLSGRWRWLAARWAIRLVAVAGGMSITLLVVETIFDGRGQAGLPAFVWLAWLAGVYFVYRKVRPDLFILAGGCLSGIVVLVSFMGKHMQFTGGAYLFMALVVIGLGAGSAIWLKKVNRELQS